jgi:hypothetical protein
MRASRMSKNALAAFRYLGDRTDVGCLIGAPEHAERDIDAAKVRIAIRDVTLPCRAAISSDP